jgi:uncharacterized membrane protein
MGWDTVLKLGALGVCIIIVLQLIFYFAFQIIGYNSFWLSITLIASILVFIVMLVLLRAFKKAVTEKIAE